MNRLMSPSALAEYIGVSTSKVRDMVKRGELPQPQYIGPRMPRWDRRQIESWVDERFEQVPQYDDPDLALDQAYEDRKAAVG